MKKIIFTALVASAFFSSPIFAASAEGAGGQGAIAGSASMYLQEAGAEVSHVSSSIAVGKANAYTTGDIVLNSDATNSNNIKNSVTNTSALGTGGMITISDGTNDTPASGTISVASEVIGNTDPKTGLKNAQANKMRAATVDLNTTTADNNPSFNGLVK